MSAEFELLAQNKRKDKDAATSDAHRTGRRPLHAFGLLADYSRMAPRMTGTPRAPAVQHSSCGSLAAAVAARAAGGCGDTVAAASRAKEVPPRKEQQAAPPAAQWPREYYARHGATKSQAECCAWSPTR